MKNKWIFLALSFALVFAPGMRAYAYWTDQLQIQCSFSMLYPITIQEKANALDAPEEAAKNAPGLAETPAQVEKPAVPPQQSDAQSTGMENAGTEDAGTANTDAQSSVEAETQTENTENNSAETEE